MSGTDAVFLGMETANTPQHVAALCVLDPGPDGIAVERIKANVRRVLPQVPKFLRVIKTVPFGLDLPVWDDDHDFDLDRHVRHIAVPSPGGKAEVGNLLGELMSMPLDRRFPLWEMWIIEGLADGRKAATFLKYHHSLMDGKSGASLAEHLFQLGPDDVAPEAPPHQRVRAPSSLELLLRSPIKGVKGTWHTVEYATAFARRVAVTIQHRQQGKRFANLLTGKATVFNGALGRRRQMAFASLSLDDVKRIAKDQGVKVNDVVMTVLAGAAHRYLSQVSEVPDGPINVFMAVSTSIADDEGHSNKVASVPISLPIHLDDPVERLRDIFESTSHAKVLLTAMRAHKIQSIGSVAPPVLLNLASQALARAEVSSRLPAAAAFVVSNIPGPPIPLWSAGSKVLGIFAGSVLLANGALNVTLMSYDGRLDFGLTVDPDIVPQVHLMAEAVPDALGELLAALDLGPRTGIVDAWA